MKVEGTVKWFSNKKGYGFVTPTSDNKPSDEVIFVHQTGIISEGYRTLAPGIQVEFDIETEETGKLKCVNVTLPGGAPIQPSALPRRPYRGDGGGGDNAENAENTTPAEPKTTNNNRREKKENFVKDKEGGQGTAAPKEKEIPFHKVIAADVKAGIETSSGLKLGENTTTVDISLNDARIKLGQGGYASMALAEGLIAEGSYKCDATGTVTFTWEHVMKCQGEAWVKGSTDGILSSFALTDAAVKPVGPKETAASLWGEDKPDPKDFFAPNGFKMKRVVLSRPPGNRAGGGGGGRRYHRRGPRKAAGAGDS